MHGFIKLHRKIENWEWYSDANTFRVFLHLLLKANHQPSKFRGFDVPTGACVTGRTALAQALDISEKNVRTALDHLKVSGEVAIKSTNKFSIISIVKWNEYQTDVHQPAINRPATGQQVATSKEGENGRIDNPPLDPPEGEKPNSKPKREKSPVAQKPDCVPDQVWTDFQAIRKAKRAPLTQTALDGIAKQAELARLDLGQALAICCQRGWQGFQADWIKPEDRPAPVKTFNGTETVRIAVHEEPETFDRAMAWAMQHLPNFRESGQEFLTIPKNVAENLRKH